MRTNKISSGSNQKQIDELMTKIEKELNKPEKKIDMQLVDSYFGQIEELDGGMCKKTDEELAEGLNQIKEQGERIKRTITPTTINTPPVRRTLSLPKRLAISFAAVFMVIAFSFSAAAVSLGGFGNAWLYVSNSVKEILGMKPGEIEVDGITIIKGEYRKEYDTIEELLLSEQFNDIMYPSKLPNNAKIKSITQIQLDDERYSIVFKFNSDNFEMHINSYYKVDLSLLSDCTIYQANKIDFYVMLIDNIYHATAQFEGKEYNINCNNYENLIYVLSNLCFV